MSGGGNPALGDMLRSIAVLGAIVLVLFAVGLFFRPTPDDPVDEVNYASTVQHVRSTVDYPVLAPRELPEGWRATSARYTPGDNHAWHLGVLTADDTYLGLEQATVTPSTLLDKHAPGSTAQGHISIDGATWQVRTTDDDRVLVRESDGVTTLALGSASTRVLRDYVSSLSPESSGSSESGVSAD